MIAVGVDTHKDNHQAVALDSQGQILGELAFTANSSGYQQFIDWSDSLGHEEIVIGLEGAGSWGAGLCESLLGASAKVFEVERPSRKDRTRGKSDLIDALAAAKTVLSGRNLARPRARGPRAAIATMLAGYRSAVAEHTRVVNQLQSLVASAPTALRERIGAGSGKVLQKRLLRMRCRSAADLEEQTTFMVVRDLAKRAQSLDQTTQNYTNQLKLLIPALHSTLLDEPGVGPISAAKLLAADPRRFKNEQAFARCNGTAPLEASSGKTVRHRLSRRGDRQVNCALHTIALSRAQHHPESRAYLERKMSDGKTRREAVRALKRQLSRRLYKRICAEPLTT